MDPCPLGQRVIELPALLIFVLRAKEKVILFMRKPETLIALFCAAIVTFVLVILDNYQLVDYRINLWLIGPGALVLLVPDVLFLFEMNLLPISIAAIYYSIVFYHASAVRSLKRVGILIFVVICINTLSLLSVEIFLE